MNLRIQYGLMKKGKKMINFENELLEIIQEHPYIQELFDVTDQYLEDYYIGAGVITQTVWNKVHGFELTYGIGDADIIYFNSIEKPSREQETKTEAKIRKALPHFPFTIDVTNEALVHHWYEQKFNKKIAPYQSAEEAIDTWPTTASAIGVKRVEGEYRVYAPFGLEDLFKGIVRPNKILIPKEVYKNKAAKWKARWPGLTVLEWST
ncbi:nucleotidyltransferase family protein [Halobacillus sp. K22]|uniref:nucleotidyltransferase family protein n=1 Tax=Halobacillus sp. K22 TaxID=3457431 RepID=UPI003FCD56A7